MTQWQPIETAPKGQPVYNGYARGPLILGAYVNDAGDWHVYRLVSWAWHKNGKSGAWKSEIGNWQPTHWMPLPEPPKVTE